MTFEHPTPPQIPLLRQLWKTAFGDTDAYLDAFFDTAFSPQRCRCAFSGGQLAGMLYWFGVSCRGEKMVYLYAVATAPEFRGQGVCRRLMEDTHALLSSLGYAGAILVPQEEELRKMYEGMGYQSFGSIREIFCAAGNAPAPLHTIDAAEFKKLRRQLLPQGSVIQEEENLAFLETQAQFYRGTDFLLAAQPTAEGALFAPELLGNAAAAPGILLALGYPQGTFRTPGTQLPYGMFRPLTKTAQPPEYFGFSFD